MIDKYGEPSGNYEVICTRNVIELGTNLSTVDIGTQILLCVVEYKKRRSTK